MDFQQLPSTTPFENFGWENRQNKIENIMTDQLPSPLALVELSACSCKTLCKNNHCNYHEYDLPCTDMCKCISCQNEGQTENYSFDKTMNTIPPRRTASKTYLLFVCFKNGFNIITY